MRILKTGDLTCQYKDWLQRYLYTWYDATTKLLGHQTQIHAWVPWQTLGLVPIAYSGYPITECRSHHPTH